MFEKNICERIKKFANVKNLDYRIALIGNLRWLLPNDDTL